MTLRLEHRDTETFADVKAQRDALFGALIELGIASDALPYGPNARMPEWRRRESERGWASHWWGVATADDEHAQKLRDLAHRQDRGTE